MKLAYAAATAEVVVQALALMGDPEDCFRLVASCGYDGVELMPARPCEVDADHIRALADRYGLTVPMVCTGELYGQERLMFTDPDPARRHAALDAMKAAIDLAAPFGAFANVGRLRGKLTPGREDDSLKLAHDAFAQAADYGAARGVKVLLEPIASGIADFLHGTEDGLAAVAHFHHPGLGLMLDLAHMVAEGEEVPSSFRHAAGRFDYVHITDSDRLPPGQGTWDLPTVLDALGDSGYAGYVSVESRQVPNPGTAARGAYEVLRRWQT